MKQIIRNKTFETNSSSTHTLSIYKHTNNVGEIDLDAHIPIMDNFHGDTKDPETILSYIYTMALVSHNWKVIDKIKQEFPLCIFQKPQWELPYESDTGYCDDRAVISFCELLNTELPCYFDEDDMNTIWAHLKEFVFEGELYVGYDGDYITDCIAPKVGIDPSDSITINKWVDDNIEIILTV